MSDVTYEGFKLLGYTIWMCIFFCVTVKFFKYLVITFIALILIVLSLIALLSTLIGAYEGGKVCLKLLRNKKRN